MNGLVFEAVAGRSEEAKVYSKLRLLPRGRVHLDPTEAHQAAASRIPPDLLVRAKTLLAEPARGAYYDRLPRKSD